MRAETDPAVAAEFWAKSHRKAERRKEIALMRPGLERMNAILADTWNPRLAAELFSVNPLLRLNRNRGNELDEWLAEDGRMPEVARALL